MRLARASSAVWTPEGASHDLVQWELTQLGASGNGPYRLTVRHARGTIVEYFQSTPLALVRLAELDDLLSAAHRDRQILADIRS